jgi:predicted nucleotidyltransferase
MNQATQWRLQLAREIALGYTQNPHVRVLVIAGSVSRGRAYDYSDIEIDVWWEHAPTDADGLASMKRVAATLLDFYPYEAGEWSDSHEALGVKIEMSQFLVATREQYLDDVLTRCDTEEDKQVLIYAVQHCIPLHGENLIAHWRAPRISPTHWRTKWRKRISSSADGTASQCSSRARIGCSPMI